MAGTFTKNLLLRDKKDRLFLFAILEDRRLDLRTLHARVGAHGRLGLAPAERMREVLGVEPGALTPLALINDERGLVTAVVDASLLSAEQVNFHPLINTESVGMRPIDLLAFIESCGREALVVDLEGWGAQHARAAIRDRMRVHSGGPDRQACRHQNGFSTMSATNATTTERSSANHKKARWEAISRSVLKMGTVGVPPLAGAPPRPPGLAGKKANAHVHHPHARSAIAVGAAGRVPGAPAIVSPERELSRVARRATRRNDPAQDVVQVRERVGSEEVLELGFH
jgi:Ala-tRNA(Pro) deacylase